MGLCVSFSVQQPQPCAPLKSDEFSETRRSIPFYTHRAASHVCMPLPKPLSPPLICAQGSPPALFEHVHKRNGHVRKTQRENLTCGVQSGQNGQSVQDDASRRASAENQHSAREFETLHPPHRRVQLVPTAVETFLQIEKLVFAFFHTQQRWLRPSHALVACTTTLVFQLLTGRIGQAEMARQAQMFTLPPQQVFEAYSFVVLQLSEQHCRSL